MEVKLNVLFTRDFKDKVDYFSFCYDKEIAGWITGEISEGTIVIKDLLIPEQEADSGGVKMSGKDIVNLKKEYKKKCDKIIGEWHSHHSMGAFWSSTDEGFMDEFMKPRDCCVFIVSSKGEHLIRVELRKPFNLTIDKVPYEVEVNSEVMEECKKIIKKKIREPVVVSAFATTTPSVKSKDKTLNELLGRLVNYYNDKRVVVEDVSWDLADRIQEEFGEFKPSLQMTGNMAKLEFRFDDKDKALKVMKEIKESIKYCIEESQYPKDRYIRNEYVNDYDDVYTRYFD